MCDGWKPSDSYDMVSPSIVAVWWWETIWQLGSGQPEAQRPSQRQIITLSEASRNFRWQPRARCTLHMFARYICTLYICTLYVCTLYRCTLCTHINSTNVNGTSVDCTSLNCTSVNSTHLHYKNVHWTFEHSTLVHCTAVHWIHLRPVSTVQFPLVLVADILLEGKSACTSQSCQKQVLSQAYRNVAAQERVSRN